MAGTLLCIGHMAHDLYPLVRVAEPVQRQLQLEPVFLINSPQPYFEKAKHYIDATGFRTVDLPADWNSQPHMRNPLQRYATIRRENRNIARRALQSTQPTVILASVDSAHNQFFAEASRAGIPSIYLQVAFWGTRKFYKELEADDHARAETHFTRAQKIRRFIARRIQNIYGIGARPAWERPATRIAVLGPYWRRLLIENGMSAQQVVATGNYATDDIFQLRFGAQDWRKPLCAKIGLAEGAPYFLHCRENLERFATLSEASRQDSQIQVLTALRRADADIPIVVKLHPRDGEGEIQLIQKIEPHAIIIRDTVPTLELIAASRLMVSTLSTTLIWSAALDVPTFSFFSLPGINYFRREANWTGVQRVHTAEELTQAVVAQLTDAREVQTWREKRATFTQDQLCLEGDSIARLVNLVDELGKRQPH